MADETLAVNLKVLSPSAELEGGLSLPDLPASTTVKELRSRIQDAVASRPALERMRLIYRGRVVANNADTLESVFGTENLRENKDQSLHLVIRELPPSTAAAPSPTPRAATVPNPFRPTQPSVPASPLQTNPFRTIPSPQSSSQPQTPQPQLPHHHHHHHPHAHPQVHHHHHPQGAANPFAIPVPPQIQQQLAQAMAQNLPVHIQPPLQPQANTTNSEGQQPGGSTPPPTDRPTPPPRFMMGPQNVPGRTVRQEGVGPNGERWSVTYNEVNIPPRPQHPMMVPPFVMPPGFVPPARPAGSPAPAEAINRVLAPLRTILDRARREMQNVTTLFQLPEAQQGLASTGLPGWRVNRVREHVQTMSRDLDTVERGLVMLAEPALAQNPDVVALRQSVSELRLRLAEMNQALARTEALSSDRQPPNDTPASASLGTAQAASSSDTSNATIQTETPATTQTLPAGAPPELFILSSPQGPVGILFDQRGTYATGPMVQTLPFQTFTDQFARNRQLIAGLGQQIAQGSGQLHNQLANIQSIPTPTQPTTAEAHGSNQLPAQPQNPDQNQNQQQPQPQPQNQLVNGNANQPAENPPAANAPNDMANIAGHLWLIFKLACFVYFFAGGASYYRMFMLGMIAVVVYLVQVGIFETQFNVLRRHFEALLPIGALADRVAQPHQPRAGGLTPEQAAQRLMQERRDERFGWLRDGLRTLERSFALFAASLWPGVGEGMVHAQEERLRLERVAQSEERERQEEERRRGEEQREQREQQNDEREDKQEDEHKTGDEGPSEASSSRKGKERADTAERAEAVAAEGSAE